MWTTLDNHQSLIMIIQELSYISILSWSSYVSLRKDILNHWDINLIFFFNCNILYFIINIYPDDQQTILKNTELNLNNILIMTGNFNIRDNNWNPLYLYLHHSIHMNTLWKVANSFNLELSLPINQVPTLYMKNPQDSNLVSDLMFLWADTKEFNNYQISPDLWSLSDHAPLLVCIIIEEVIQDRKQTIVKNSEEEKELINKLRNRISYINIINILNCKILECITQEFAFITEKLWYKYSKMVNITKCSKAWWNKECNSDLAIY